MSTSAGRPVDGPAPARGLLRRWWTTPRSSRPATRRCRVAVADHRRHRTAPYAAVRGAAAGPRRRRAPAPQRCCSRTSGSASRSSSGPARTRPTLPTAVTSSSGRAARWCAASSCRSPTRSRLHPLRELRRAAVARGLPRAGCSEDLDAVGRGGRATPSCAPAVWPPDDVPSAAGARRVHRRVRSPARCGSSSPPACTTPCAPSTRSTGLDQHGVANVLVATALADSTVARLAEVRGVLDERDPAVLRLGAARPRRADDVDRSGRAVRLVRLLRGHRPAERAGRAAGRRPDPTLDPTWS